MKLAVSNIAWANNRLDEHLHWLSQLGCNGVELAPSCIWAEPIEASATERTKVARMIAGAGLELAGFHALLFTRPDLQLFRDHASCEELLGYLGDLAGLCADLGGKRMVLGSPRNRVRYSRTQDACREWAAEAFTRLAQRCAALDVVVCIEPLGADETEFIMSSAEGAELVRRVDHPNFGLHLDAKALFSTGEDLAEVLLAHGDLLRHFHVSDPGLAPPGTSGLSHAPFGKALRDISYDGYVSIEMRRTEGDSLKVVAQSVDFVKRHYLGTQVG